VGRWNIKQEVKSEKAPIFLENGALIQLQADKSMSKKT
jgi:hypothetical protein